MKHNTETDRKGGEEKSLESKRVYNSSLGKMECLVIISLEENTQIPSRKIVQICIVTSFSHHGCRRRRKKGQNEISHSSVVPFVTCCRSHTTLTWWRNRYFPPAALAYIHTVCVLSAGKVRPNDENTRTC